MPQTGVMRILSKRRGSFQNSRCAFLGRRESESIRGCAELLFNASLVEGTKLWSRLLQLAAENRAAGGYLDLSKLVRILRPDFELRDFADLKLIGPASKSLRLGT